MISGYNRSKWWGILVVLMLTFSAADVCFAQAPLPTHSADESGAQKKSTAQKIKDGAQRAKQIYLKSKDLAQKGYGAACQAFSVASQAVASSLAMVNDLKDNMVSMAKNLGECGADLAKKIVAQKKEDKAECKKLHEKDPDTSGYKQCIEERKVARKQQKKDGIRACKAEANKAIAASWAKTKADARDIGKNTASGMNAAFTFKTDEEKQNALNQKKEGLAEREEQLKTDYGDLEMQYTYLDEDLRDGEITQEEYNKKKKELDKEKSKLDKEQSKINKEKEKLEKKQTKLDEKNKSSDESDK